MSLEHESSHNNTGIFVEITNDTLYGSKLCIFLLCQKSLGHYEDIYFRKYIKT